MTLHYEIKYFLESYKLTDEEEALGGNSTYKKLAVQRLNEALFFV